MQLQKGGGGTGMENVVDALSEVATKNTAKEFAPSGLLHICPSGVIDCRVP